jgi:drug/metabolite transporter (DMT)-like permease
MEKAISTKKPSSAKVIAAFAALYLIWGSTYIAILIAVKDIPPFLMAGTRFFIAGILLYGWCRIKGDATPDISSFQKISLGGILMLFFGTTSLIWVEQYISSGIAAIIVATVPLWFVVLDKRQWKFHFKHKLIVAGLLVGFSGVLLLFLGKGENSMTDDRMKLISLIVLLAGSILWVIGSLYAKYKPVDGSTTMKASIQMMAAGFTSFIVGLCTGELNNFSFSQVSFNAFAAVIYLITFGSLVGFLAYVWLLSVKPPSVVGTYAYVNPVVAVFLGWLIADESISFIQIIALIVILVGVIIVNFSKQKLEVKEKPRNIEEKERERERV